MDFASVTDITTPAGSLERIQRGGVTIWEKSRGAKYKIRKDGVEVARVTIPTLQRMIGDGTAQSRFGIGAQLVLSYTYNEYVSEFPMNFGTFRTFEKEDGAMFSGLGLESFYVAAHNMSFNFYSGLSSRWAECSLRDWMNSAGMGWEKKEIYSPSAQFVNRAGLLDSFPSDFIDALSAVKVSTRSSGQLNVDITYDRFFPLSLEEKNISVTKWYASYTPPSIAPASGVEGTVWEYWIQKLGDTPFEAGTDATHGALIYYKRISNSIETCPAVYLRTRYVAGVSVDGVVHVLTSNGGVSGNYAVQLGDDVAPACVLPAA